MSGQWFLDDSGNTRIPCFFDIGGRDYCNTVSVAYRISPVHVFVARV